MPSVGSLFGVSGLMLIYIVIPILIRVMGLIDPGALTIVCRVLAMAFIVDCTLYQLLKNKRDD